MTQPFRLEEQFHEIVARAKKEIEDLLGDEAVRQLRNRLVSDIEACFTKRLEDIRHVEDLLEANILNLLADGVIPFRTKAVQVSDRLPQIEISWRGLDLRCIDPVCYSSTRFTLPSGLWRLIILAVTVDPNEELTEWDKAGLDL